MRKQIWVTTTTKIILTKADTAYKKGAEYTFMNGRPEIQLEIQEGLLLS